MGNEESNFYLIFGALSHWFLSGREVRERAIAMGIVPV